MVSYTYRRTETVRQGLGDKTYNSLVPPIMMLSESEEIVEEEITYPYPLVDEEEINNSDDWSSDEVI